MTYRVSLEGNRGGTCVGFKVYFTFRDVPSIDLQDLANLLFAYFAPIITLTLREIHLRYWRRFAIGDSGILLSCHVEIKSRKKQ
jgi:hypothetical protein